MILKTVIKTKKLNLNKIKTISVYIMLIGAFGIIGLISLDRIVLPLITNYNKSIYLPDLTSIDFRIAQKRLDSLDLGYKIIMHEYDDLYKPYSVIEMSPRPFTKLKTGRIIKLTVADEKKDIILDDYSDKSLRSVKLQLNRDNLKIDTLIYEYNESVKKDFIISQYPRTGKMLKSGDMLTLIVSQGPPPNYYITPNLINMSLKKAKEMISKAGLVLGNITYEYNTKYLNNTVLEQNKTPGMRLSFPAKIDLIISTDK
mgnify:CR=1 FL=1